MRNIFLIIISIAFVYVIKKGSESAILKNERLDFLSTFKRGLQITQSEFLKRNNPDTRTFATAAAAINN